MKVHATTITPNLQTLILPVPGRQEAVLRQAAALVGLSANTLISDFNGDAADILPLYAGDQRVVLLGLGEKPSFAEIQRCFRVLAYKWGKVLGSQVAINWQWTETGSSLYSWAEAGVNGMLLGAYQPGRYKTETPAIHPLLAPDAEIQLVAGSDAEAPLLQAAAERSLVIARTQRRIMDLVNAPSNYKRPAELGEWAAASAAEYGYRATVWNQNEIKAAGMHALLAVNQGSAHPAAFIVAEYEPKALGNYPTVALVGKGVTFDTGGISIKASANMHYMKSDMGGAAAVLGTLEAAAQLQVPVRLLGFIPATENSVDANAVKPGDVIGSYAGKTIEVIDTDAEGRLILADALSYAVRQYKPDVIIDLATLTGSAVRTLGYVAGALFTHNDSLANALYQAGWNCGERLWRLPLWDLYKDDVKSDVADLRNFSGKPTAGAISAAKFLEAFVDNHTAWAHLDIAGVAYTDSEVNGGKTASAYGIRLLLTYLQGLT
jgi:leucyl aminopeptidase